MYDFLVTTGNIRIKFYLEELHKIFNIIDNPFASLEFFEKNISGEYIPIGVLSIGGMKHLCIKFLVDTYYHLRSNNAFEMIPDDIIMVDCSINLLEEFDKTKDSSLYESMVQHIYSFNSNYRNYISPNYSDNNNIYCKKNIGRKVYELTWKTLVAIRFSDKWLIHEVLFTEILTAQNVKILNRNEYIMDFIKSGRNLFYL